MFNDERKDKIEQLIEIMKDLDWNIAYKLDLEDNEKICGIVCGDDNFIESVLNAVSAANGDTEIMINELNPTERGDKEGMN